MMEGDTFDLVGPSDGDSGGSGGGGGGNDVGSDDNVGGNSSGSSSSNVVGDDAPRQPPREEVAAVVGAAWGLSPPPTPPAGGRDAPPVEDPLPRGTRLALALGAGLVAAVLGARAVALWRTRLVCLRHNPATGAVRAYTYRPSGRAGLALAAEAPAGGVGVDHASLRRATDVAARLRSRAGAGAGGAGGGTPQRTAADRAAAAKERAEAVLTLAVDAGAAGTRAFTVDVVACEVFEGRRLAALAVDTPKEGGGRG